MTIQSIKAVSRPKDVEKGFMKGVNKLSGSEVGG
jgi:hypothetical protein